jgi:Protein of unknown function (DUF2680)
VKRFIAAAILVGALVALVSGTVLAAEPTTPPVPAAGVQAGMYPCGGAGAGGMMGGGRPEWAGQPVEVATLLGMEQGDIQAKRQAGESLAQIAAGKNVSEDTLISTILNSKKEVLAKLVDGGKLTQEQADLMIQNMTSRIKTMVERTDVGPAFGQGGARGMMGQGMRGGRWNRS